MVAYRDGAVVECTKGESLIRGRLHTKEWPGQTCQYVGDAGDVYRYIKEGWTVTVVEEPALPTEPGFYRAKYENSPSGFVVIELLNSPRRWVDSSDSRYLEKSWVRDLTDLTRMDTEEATARRVLARLNETYGENYFTNADESWNKVAREFGVTS